MATVVADMSMSLDGFVADPSDGADRVLAWYGKPQPAAPRAEGAAGGRDAARLAVIVYGRRTFEVAGGWGGNHPVGVPVIVVAHSVPDGWPREESTVSFATDGSRARWSRRRRSPARTSSPSAARASPSSASIWGWWTGIHIKLVPLLLGDGVRFFDALTVAPIELEGPSVDGGQRRHPSLLPRPLSGGGRAWSGP
jgi:hypothetical protein